jgi:hypothetical protein
MATITLRNKKTFSNSGVPRGREAKAGVSVPGKKKRKKRKQIVRESSRINGEQPPNHPMMHHQFQTIKMMKDQPLLRNMEMSSTSHMSMGQPMMNSTISVSQLTKRMPQSQPWKAPTKI